MVFLFYTQKWTMQYFTNGVWMDWRMMAAAKHLCISLLTGKSPLLFSAGPPFLPSAFEYSIPFPEQEGRLASELLLHGLDEVDVGEDVLLVLDVLRPGTLDGFGFGGGGSGGRGGGVVVVSLLVLVLLFLRAALMKMRERMRG